MSAASVAILVCAPSLHVFFKASRRQNVVLAQINAWILSNVPILSDWIANLESNLIGDDNQIPSCSAIKSEVCDIKGAYCQ